MKILILSSFASLFNYLMLILIGIVIAGNEGAALYGNFALILAITTFVSYAIDFGSSQLLRQFIPAYQSNADHAKIKGIVTYTITLTSFITLMLIIAIFITEHLTKYQYNNLERFDYIFMALISLCLAEIRIGSSIINCKGYFLMSSLLYKAIYPLLLFFAVLFIIHLGTIPSEEKLHYLLYGYLTALVITLLVTVIFILIWTRINLKCKGEFNLSSWLHNGVNYCVNSLSLFSSSNVGIFVLEWLGPSEAIVGYYAALIGIINILLLFLTLTNRYYIPKLSNFFYRENYSKINRLLKTRLSFLTIIAIIFIIIIITTGKWILSLYGPNFANYYLTLVILSIAIIFEILMGISTFLLIMCKDNHLAMVAQLTMITTTIVLTIVLVPFINIYGALIAFMVPKLLISLFITFWLQKKYNIKIFAFRKIRSEN